MLVGNVTRRLPRSLRHRTRGATYAFPTAGSDRDPNEQPFARPADVEPKPDAAAAPVWVARPRVDPAGGLRMGRPFARLFPVRSAGDRQSHDRGLRRTIPDA